MKFLQSEALFAIRRRDRFCDLGACPKFVPPGLDVIWAGNPIPHVGVKLALAAVVS